MTRRFSIPVMLFVTMFVMAACGGTESSTPSTPATATLQGALVPTRIATNTPTATNTVQPSDTPTERPSNTPTATATERPSNTPTPATPVVEPIRDIGVRLGPGSEYPIIATMTADDRLDVLGISEDGAWYQVVLPSGEIGWLVSSIAFVDAQGDLASLPIAAVPTETPTLTNTPSPTATATETPLPASPTPDTVALQQALSEAEIFLDLERYEDAVDKFTEVLELDPNNFEALEGRGEAYLYLNEEMSALEDLNQALEILPNSLDARISRGITYYNMGQMENARVDLDFVIDQSPLESEAYYYRAFTYLDGGNPNEFDLGIRDLTRYIELEPTDADGYYQRGMAFYYAENYQAARPDLQRYVEIVRRENADIEVLDALADIDQQVGPPPTPGGPVAADSIRIEYGAIVEGEITNETPEVYYVFEARAGQVIGIRMDRGSGNLDPFLILIDPQGNELIRNDDDPDNLGFNAYIREFVIPMDGPYTISATRFSSTSQTEGTTGTFELELELVREGSSVGPTPPPGEGQLTYGAVVEGLINNDNWSAVYTFDGRAGEIIGIQMEATSGTLDTFIILIDPQGNELVRNDDDPENLGFDAYLRNFRLPIDGLYTIVATRFREENGPSSGEFRLRLERAGDVQGSDAGGPGMPPTDAEPIAIGDTVTGSINDTQINEIYSFEAQGGEQISISMSSSDSDLDTFVLLLAPDGRELARNDDADDDTTNSRIENIQLPGGGTYYVVATRYNTLFSGETAGDFTLTVSESSGPLNVQPAQIITYDQTVEGTFTDDIWQRTYTFFATQGDTVNIHVRRAEDIDSRMILTNNLGEEIYRSDDGFDGDNFLNPWLTLGVLPETGHYTIVVESSDPGPYDVELTLDTAGDPEAAYPAYGVLYADYSGGLLETGDPIFYMLAGDWKDDNDVVRVSAAYMTFHLPELDGTVATATLEIDWCVDFTDNDPDVVSQLGDINIYGNGYFTAETFTYDKSPVNGAEVISIITDCDVVDVTAFIEEAYANNATLVQFRAEISGVIDNDSIDGWLFTQPRLIIEK